MVTHLTYKVDTYGIALKWAYTMLVRLSRITLVSPADAQINIVCNEAQDAINRRLPLYHMTKAMVNLETPEELIGQFIYEYHKQLEQEENL